MRRLTVVPAALMLATLAVSCDPATANADTCPEQMTFAVGGVGDPGARHVPGISGPVARVHYSASLAPVGPVGGNDSAREGERNLDRAARSFRARCPDSTIVVQGQSLGALVAGNVRDKWANDPTMRRNTRAVLISDPRAHNGAMSVLPSFIPGFTHTGPRPHSTIPTASTCRDDDAICNIGNPLTNPGHAINAGIGYLVGGAHGYSNNDVNKTPGQHDLPPSAQPIPETPIPWAPPTPRQILEPLAREVVPTAPIITDHYVPTPVRDYLPPAIKRIIPRDWGRNVLPPLP
ncbi:MAG: PE-PPE domain-containing protein [Gordonia sp. (in: high G+C Gram-positive bacteria)]|uniref:cutinase family protein n=1 Tax=Gordonia sp. (in: high G+C Gram-positive bacteria) TaxID=84139 RepID=UPI003C70D57E